MAELKDVLNGVLVKALSFTDQEVAALYEAEDLKEGSLDVILQKRSEVVQAEKAKVAKDREEQRMRGKKEGAKKWEDFLKNEGVELGDMTGESPEAFAKVQEHLASLKVPATGPELDDAKVKAHPLYVKLERESNGKVTAKEQEWEKKWTERDAKEQRDRTIAEAVRERDDLVKAIQPILPEDPEKARRLMKVIDMDIESHTYETDGESVYVIDKEGKRVETSTGIPVTRKQFLENAIRSTFDVPVSDKKGSLGNPLNGTLNKGTVKLQKPANRDELAKQRHAITTSGLPYADRKAANEQLDELAKDLV